MESTPYILESQPDWLTVVCHGDASSRALMRVATELATPELADGNRMKPFRSQGYNGWSCARVRAGSCDRGTLVQLSGDLAATAFDRVYPLAEAVNRIDLAVTVVMPINDEDLAFQHSIEYEGWTPSGRKKAVHEYKRYPNGGTSLIVGKRASELYLRVYDKQRESNDTRYIGAWRYELECKATAAERLAMDCAGCADRAAFCQGALHDYLHDHGIRPPFDPATQRMLSPGFRRRSDARSRLTWLRRSVAPSVGWFRQIGRADEALESLGLQRQAQGGWDWATPPDRAL